MRNKSIEIGKIIKKRREMLGLLQPDLAKLAHVSRRTVQLVELGTGNPSLDTLARLCDVLGLTVQLGLKGLSNQESLTDG